MSVGSIPIPRRISDAQFVGDLFGLFKRHRIETAVPGSFVQFESLLTSKDAFRSQLFTLCTAISHMADADLSGEQLFDLVARALGESDEAAVVSGGARDAFLSGYEAWCNRDLDAPEVWPPVRNVPVNEPIPFPAPTEGFAEETTPAVRAPGMRTVQEALLMAKKESPFELPPRAVQPVASGSGVNVEGLTISELTKLLEDIEHRMSRIKPQMSQLSGLVLPAPETLERQTKTPLKPSLVTPASAFSPPVSSPHTIEASFLLAEPAVKNPKDDKFLARHSYLNAGRRLPPDTPIPEFQIVKTIPIVTAPPPAAARVAVAALEPVAPMTTALEVAAPAVAGTAVLAPGEPPQVPVIVDQSTHFPIAVAYKSERFRLYFHIAVGVFAAFILVACPLAGVVLFRSLHTVHRYEYHGLAPAIPAAAVTAPAANAAPAVGVNPVVAGSAAAGPVAPAAHASANHGTKKQVKRPPQVAVWPPPPPSQ